MTPPGGVCPFRSRRGVLAAAAGLAGALAGRRVAAGGAPSPTPEPSPVTEPFWGEHQSGILTPPQRHTCFAAFDVVAPGAATGVAGLAALLRGWTDAASRLAAGEPAAADSGEALGLPPSRLTLTFGFGPGLFAPDRFGLAARRPAALVELPRFNGDQLVPARCGGDLSVQACADDPQVALHAVRQLARLAYGAAQLRWLQSGFLPGVQAGETPRNLMGFKDGTRQPADPGRAVWVGEEAPDWLRGGSYVVVRRIRIALEHWDRTATEFQEQVIGRRKRSGAPLGGRREADPLDLDATGPDGNPVIPDDAHVRLGAAASAGGAQILRRGYAYDDGADFTAERWPPWRQGVEFDAGLLFLAYQRDPRSGFIRIYDRMSRLDALNQFTTHTGSALFACPGGVGSGGFVGEALLRG